ncbi:MAG: DUF423 domain-containing protein [Methylobacter sp.]|nr:DUF423 domain-containing protein [Methylobacter sp.]MDP2098281.1 DUF423 domain-containing protein [Methylobacter sp.]MDP2426778.1 DUF423 domain-containing protein [Methylobacter sp.]MDP3054672.1 DUF423 domain-containing protein [Methylobacter sp.]MDP3361724.1 DUF423 domain-containing protein [Methylobacter sp.]
MPFLLLGALSALVGVAMGAFGAHGLKAILSPELLTIYQTGATYQMYHALGLIAIALFHRQAPDSKLLHWAGWLMFIGILLFSGSLYLLALLNLKWLGMITPLGGVCFITAWLLLSIFAAKHHTILAHHHR